MRKSLRPTGLGLVALAVALLAAPAGADVWDTQAEPDNGNTTENVLIHGSSQLHDLGDLAGPTADQDWYRVRVPGKASFEVLVDSPSGDIGALMYVERVSSAGTVIQDSGDVAPYFGRYARTLRWENTATTTAEEFVRVMSGNCGPPPAPATCGAEDVYRVNARETTYGIPRFNNSATQITILQIQNAYWESASVSIHFWSTAGVLLGTSTATLAPRALLVLNTSSLAFANGTSGSITVSHTAPFGFLAGKAVALEPATGFTFDTPMVSRGI